MQNQKQNKGNNEMIDTFTSALREDMFQALVVVITVAGLQSRVLLLDTFFLPFSFFPSPSLKGGCMRCLLCNV